MAKDIRVLLYYLYTPIENAEQFAADHLAFCKSIGLKGRILVADEGINGTVSGDYETTQKYMDYVHSLPGMEDLWFKIDEESEQAFKKMFVRYKKEIVHLGLEDNDFLVANKHLLEGLFIFFVNLEPEVFHAWETVNVVHVFLSCFVVT